jgi:hypothetical protein
MLTPPPPNSRPTASGHTLNCYFCKTCGTRLIHSTPGKEVVSVKGGCIEGLDWGSAKHIWCKRASEFAFPSMLLIPGWVVSVRGWLVRDRGGDGGDQEGGRGG